MRDLYLGGTLWRRFGEFISPEADRFTVLKSLLVEAGLDYTVLEIAGNRHIFTAPPPPEEYIRRPRTVLVAHYDRAEGSPGANDNSAAVFLLLETAVKLQQDKAQNWIVIFTDKEELKPGESIQSQGSYTLALRLKKTTMKNSRIFSFDACGVGDTLVISTTADNLLKKEHSGEKPRDALLELRTMALDTARDLRMEKVLLAPTPFSDDAGFFRAGLAAQTITMLPSAECQKLVSELRKNPSLARALINAELRQSGRLRSIPETWRSFNSPGDSHIRLTPQHFRTVVRFAEALCRA